MIAFNILLIQNCAIHHFELVSDTHNLVFSKANRDVLVPLFVQNTWYLRVSKLQKRITLSRPNLLLIALASDVTDRTLYMFSRYLQNSRGTT